MVSFNETTDGSVPALQGFGGAEIADSKSSATRVFLVEDHAMFRKQIARLISQPGRFVLCGESDNARDALEAIEVEQPDLVIVDVTLKGMNGLDLIRELKSRVPGASTLVLSMHDESMYAERALRAGAGGYLSKDQTSELLTSAMDKVVGGGVYLSPHMTSELVRKVVSEEDEETSHDALRSLSPREMDLFRLIAKGCTTHEIAGIMQLAEKTVHSYRLQIKTKLGIKHCAELYTMAARWWEDQSGVEAEDYCPESEVGATSSRA